MALLQLLLSYVPCTLASTLYTQPPLLAALPLLVLQIYFKEPSAAFHEPCYSHERNIKGSDALVPNNQQPTPVLSNGCVSLTLQERLCGVA